LGGGCGGPGTGLIYIYIYLWNNPLRGLPKVLRSADPVISEYMIYTY